MKTHHKGNMEPGVEDNPNPWKHKDRVTLIAVADIVLALLGIAYSSFRMFTIYWDLGAHKEVPASIAKDVHFPFWMFIWVVVILCYLVQLGMAFVLYRAVNLDAMESDPYDTVQKCTCWLRCSRVILILIVIKLCIIPVIIVLVNIISMTTIAIGIGELVFRSVSIFGLKGFMHDLQQ